MTRTFHLFPFAALLLLAWGAFAFGSEFTWAYAPLLAFSLAVSALGFLAGARRPRSTLQEYRGLILAMVLVISAVLVQIVPLPSGVVSVLSPARNDVDYARLYAQWSLREADETAAQPARTLSIAPSRSLLGLGFLGALSLLLVGTARAFGEVRPTGLVRGIIVLGVAGAFAALIQKASGTQEIYGLFMPRQAGNRSAPFINANHTAGWLVMILSLALGHLASCVDRGMRGVKPSWYDRAIWFSSRAAAEVILTAFGVAVIAIAIVSTASRSGALCLVLGSMLMAWWGTTRQQSFSKKAVTWVHVAFVLATAAMAGGADAVARRFATVSLGGADSRLTIWRDAAEMLVDFPVTGTGLNTYGVAALHYQEAKVPYLFIEAHNDYLQVAAEGGLLLGVPALVFVWLLAASIKRRFAEGEDDTRVYWLRAGAVTALCAIAFQSLFDFTLQMPGASVLFALLAGLAIHRR